MLNQRYDWSRLSLASSTLHEGISLAQGTFDGSHEMFLFGFKSHSLSEGLELFTIRSKCCQLEQSAGQSMFLLVVPNII